MTVIFSRSIGPIPISVILTESHRSEIEITSNPIETGAEVNDHAYIAPKRVKLDFSDANAAATFATLVRFQESRVPFILVTGLYVYRNMLIKSLDADRDAQFSRVLRGSAEIQEVIIVDTAYATAETGDDALSNGAGDIRTRSARLSPSRAGDAITADRVSGVVQRGDAPARAVPASGIYQSILQSIF